jgi:hypothetical protein
LAAGYTESPHDASITDTLTEVARRRSSQGQGRSWLVEAEPVGHRGRLAAAGDPQLGEDP